jgi:hypothetical protein
MILAALALSSYITACSARGSFTQLSPIPTPRRGAVGGVLYNAMDTPEVWVVGGSNSEINEFDVGKNVEIIIIIFVQFKCY